MQPHLNFSEWGPARQKAAAAVKTILKVLTPIKFPPMPNTNSYKIPSYAQHHLLLSTLFAGDVVSVEYIRNVLTNSKDRKMLI